jgi:hypothetical protein
MRLYLRFLRDRSGRPAFTSLWGERRHELWLRSVLRQ